MPEPGFIPAGEEFLATVRRPGLEEVIEGKRFPSAAAAVLHAKNHIKSLESPAPVDLIMDEHRRWKLEQAEKLRLEREAFDMRNIQVVTKKRRFTR